MHVPTYPRPSQGRETDASKTLRRGMPARSVAPRSTDCRKVVSEGWEESRAGKVGREGREGREGRGREKGRCR